MVSISEIIVNSYIVFFKQFYVVNKLMILSIKKLSFNIAAVLMLMIPSNIWAQNASVSPSEPKLTKAVMCESIEKFEPVNQAVVFSIDLGRLSCFTEFDPVPKQAVIYHQWYHHGVLISKKQLTIYPPRWSSFSSMQLRETDKGPWRLDITDVNGTIFQTLRFSITD